MKIYFAGSIRGGRDDFAIYLEIVQQLNEYGQVLTKHVGEAQLDTIDEGGSDKGIHDRDLAWLKEAECLVAEVTTPSLGVGFEIAKATGWGKPVLCLFRPSEGRALSAMISGCDGVIVRDYRTIADVKTIFAEFFTKH